MIKNKLMIAAAGSGKTQFIVKRALEILKHNPSASILITTYTINNREEIKERFLKLNNKLIPENITIQTWFSFLLQHGVRPYKYDTLNSNHNINGVLLVNKKSGEKTYIDQETGERVSVCITDSKTGKKQVVHWSEKEDVQKHYFSADNRVYTDKLSKFVFRCNEKSGGLVISRLSEIYSHIFIDEVQDLAGYDLELIKLLMKSEIEILMVGDPRQVIYLTHHESKHGSYKNGKIKEFIEEKCNTKRKKICEIDEVTLNASHRNRKEICNFSSKLYPNFNATEPCNSCDPLCHLLNQHIGIFVVKSCDIEEYLKQHSPVQLRNNIGVGINKNHPYYNFGLSKGKTFDRVLIYPTKPIIQYLKDGKLLAEQGRSGKKIIKDAPFIPSFYVALTRAKQSVGIVLDYEESDIFIEGIQKWRCE